jgi:hypothetical protein
VCENDAERLEQHVERGTVCECLDRLDEACESDVCSLVSQSCSDSCESCNADGTVCGAALTYGWTYDKNGDKVTYRSEFNYTLGRDEIVAFEMIDLGGKINEFYVSINGQMCTNIGYNLCPDGSEAWFIDCQNVEEGAIVDTCETLNKGGPLDAFTYSFTQQSECPQSLTRSFICMSSGA